MKRITCKLRTLAVMLAVFSSVAAMGQPQTQQEQQKKDKPEWLKELSSRITLSGYAQAGWSYQNPNNKATNAYNLKRTLLWAKARITDRWSTHYRQMVILVHARFLECGTGVLHRLSSV